MENYIKKILPTNEAISRMARTLADNIDVKLIFIASLSGKAARLVSCYRPELPLLVASDDERVQRQLNLSWGVIPFKVPICNTFEKLLEYAMKYIRSNKLAKRGDKIIIVAGEPVGRSGNVNLIEIKTFE